MADPDRRERLPGSRLIWPSLALPGTVWVAVFFVAPFYVVLAILFGGVDGGARAELATSIHPAIELRL